MVGYQSNSNKNTATPRLDSSDTDNEFETMLLGEIRSSIEKERHCDNKSYSRRRRCGLSKRLLSATTNIHTSQQDMSTERNSEQYTMPVEGSSYLVGANNSLWATGKPQVSSFRRKSRRSTLDATSNAVSACNPDAALAKAA
mmetsp:Transcript_58412/g.174019  ORF Transcript_58412/g.174019 Transcript_58412/m.174019 type:complete len:142 (-) Transcript_58412:301-726(-)